MQCRLHLFTQRIEVEPDPVAIHAGEAHIGHRESGDEPGRRGADQGHVQFAARADRNGDVRQHAGAGQGDVLDLDPQTTFAGKMQFAPLIEDVTRVLPLFFAHDVRGATQAQPTSCHHLAKRHGRKVSACENCPIFVMLLSEAAARAAEWIAAADGLLVTAGAGMGVDSGLPDFRGPQGFWRAYPALGRRGLRFEEAASPQTFLDDPRLAWGFYGHRLALYRRTTPHRGHAWLQTMAAPMPAGLFVFTSNVDGHFARAGVPPERVFECHGSLHHLQCLHGCDGSVWPADAFEPEIDEADCLLTNALPHCPRCGALARPNVLMFGDDHWIDTRAAQQEARLARWRMGVERGVVIEIGAGTAVPTVRWFGARTGWPLIRINPDAPTTAVAGQLQLCGTALEGLAAIAAQLGVS